MRLKSILFATMLLLCGLSFTACDNSDPDEQKPSPIETPSYTMDAAKYEITDASSAYKSIELTEAGRYIIVMKGASPSNTDSDDLREFGIRKGLKKLVISSKIRIFIGENQ